MRQLFAVVHLFQPDRIVQSMGAPFDGKSIEEVENEIVLNYGYKTWLNTKVVPLTPQLEEQYKELEAT